MNTETKHTPGKWTIRKLNETGHLGLPVWEIASDSEGAIAWLQFAQGSSANPPLPDRGLADAQFIASAPDMAKEIMQLKAEKAECATAGSTW